MVVPRFGWVGAGTVMHEIGWVSSPTILDFPLVPGSGREVPSWVLAGPVLARLAALLQSMRRGYRNVEQAVEHPRGRILWQRYLGDSLVRGRWSTIPCRFADLSADPELRQYVRWALEKLRGDLQAVGGRDRIAINLVAWAGRLLSDLEDVSARKPRHGSDLMRGNQPSFLEQPLRKGLEALGWLVDERGLGGGREQDGLAWQLSLEKLWEFWVETVIRNEAARTGATVMAGRLGQTTFPIAWSSPSLRSLGHLVPDFVTRKGRAVNVIDAKYKQHLIELNDEGWRQMGDEIREAHRADIHQILAYASLFEAEQVTASLIYPLRFDSWNSLLEREKTVASAELSHGGRSVRLEIRGLPFGGLDQLTAACWS